MKKLAVLGFLFVVFTGFAVPAMADLVTWNTSSSDVYFAVNDTGYYVSPTGLTTTNAQSTISGSNFHIEAYSPAGDAGIVLYFNGGLTLGSLQSVLVNTVGQTPLNLNLWLDTGGDGQFFSFRGTQLTGLNGDSYGGAGPQTAAYDSTSSFYMLGGNGAGDTFTLAQLQGGAVSGIGANTPTALWIGANAPISADISSVQVSTVPIPAAVWLLGSGLVGLIGIRRRFKK